MTWDDEFWLKLHRQFLRVLFRFLEVSANLDEIGALCPHRSVFFCTVAAGHHDVRRHLGGGPDVGTYQSPGGPNGGNAGGPSGGGQDESNVGRSVRVTGGISFMVSSQL